MSKSSVLYEHCGGQTVFCLNAGTTWSYRSLRYRSVVTVHLTNTFIVTSLKKYGPETKFEVNPYHSVTHRECIGCCCMTWGFVEPHMRQFCVFTAPSKWKRSLSVHKICDGQHSSTCILGRKFKPKSRRDISTADEWLIWTTRIAFIGRVHLSTRLHIVLAGQRHPLTKF